MNKIEDYTGFAKVCYYLGILKPIDYLEFKIRMINPLSWVLILFLSLIALPILCMVSTDTYGENMKDLFKSLTLI